MGKSRTLRKPSGSTPTSRGGKLTWASTGEGAELTLKQLRERDESILEKILPSRRTQPIVQDEEPWVDPAVAAFKTAVWDENVVGQELSLVVLYYYSSSLLEYCSFPISVVADRAIVSRICARFGRLNSLKIKLSEHYGLGVLTKAERAWCLLGDKNAVIKTQPLTYYSLKKEVKDVLKVSDKAVDIADDLGVAIDALKSDGDRLIAEAKAANSAA